MKHAMLLLVVFTGASCGDDDAPTSPSGSSVSFFVTSTTSVTGNLGGLAGADAASTPRSGCGAGRACWRAYLSVERDPGNGNQPTHARDRIGGVLDQRQWRHPRQQRGGTARPRPVTPACSSTSAVSVSTGSGPVRRRRSNTTSSGLERRWHGGGEVDVRGLDVASSVPQVGHSDRMGPNQSTAGALSSWNSAHANQNCSNTAPRGGATASTASLVVGVLLTMKAGPQTRP